MTYDCPAIKTVILPNGLAYVGDTVRVIKSAHRTLVGRIGTIYHIALVRKPKRGDYDGLVFVRFDNEGTAHVETRSFSPEMLELVVSHSMDSLENLPSSWDLL